MKGEKGGTDAGGNRSSGAGCTMGYIPTEIQGEGDGEDNDPSKGELICFSFSGVKNQ